MKQDADLADLIWPVDDIIAFASTLWKLEPGDLIYTGTPAGVGVFRKPPVFLGDLGEIHDRVRERMREVLRESRAYPYLNSIGAQLLGHARQAAAESGATQHPLIALSDRQTLWFAWTGTRNQRTLVAMFSAAGAIARDRGVAIDVTAPVDEVRSLIGSFVKSPADVLAIAANIQPKYRRKYDRLLDEDLLDVAIARDTIDIASALAACRIACE